MTCPYTKPAYLTETEKKNCYATNRGWVILKAHGKYDVIESIADLDIKIADWHKANGVDHSPEEIKEEHKIAHTRLSRKAILEEKLAVAVAEIEKINEKLEEQFPAEVKSEEKVEKKAKKAKEAKSEGASDAE